MRVGDTFGQLAVVALPSPKKATCRCSCGTVKDFWRANLSTGRSRTCGGHRKEVGLGDRFGEWVVIDTTAPMPICRCSCGEERPVSKYALLRGGSLSCGHSRRAGPRERLRWMWRWMISRTSNPVDPMYSYYGGRGISVCPQWAESPEEYIDWAISNGFKKSAGLQVDRIDNDGPYSPENCRVVPRVVNANNKSNNVVVAAWGEHKTLGEWAADPRCSVSYGTLWYRVSAGWDPVEAIGRPPQHGGGKKRPTNNG
jgi:hypothetical protein